MDTLYYDLFADAEEEQDVLQSIQRLDIDTFKRYLKLALQYLDISNWRSKDIDETHRNIERVESAYGKPFLTCDNNKLDFLDSQEYTYQDLYVIYLLIIENVRSPMPIGIEVLADIVEDEFKYKMDYEKDKTKEEIINEQFEWIIEKLEKK
jgi:hypothetical protein